ncbi:MAG: hypothetical protein K0Q68_1954 [Moraxellaceae bacterium]|jgi:hypothetical protein|nr:hypothetical protein [Moraxellaceae bacterium]
MSSEVEVRYLLIEWQAEGVARKVEVAPSSLEVELCADGGYLVETAIFNDFHPWVGVRFLSGRESASAPTFVSASGQEMPMMQVSVDGSGTWWVRSDGWDLLQKRHVTELQRSPGLYKVRIGDTWLRIDNRLSAYGKADIQAYVDDFRGDLLWMILNDAAAATASGRGIGASSEFLTALSQFASALERVLESPAVNIREVLAPQPVERLRPGATTFPSYMRNSSARRLIGRSFTESADTAENRYLRHMIGVCCTWANAYVMAASRQIGFLGRLAELEAKTARSNREMTERPVDPDVFDQQTADLNERLAAVVSYSGQSTNEDGGARDRSFPLRLKARYFDHLAFYYEPQQGLVQSRVSKVDYRYVELPKDAFELIYRAHHFCKQFTITGLASSIQGATASRKEYLKLMFSSVVAIKPQTDVIKKRREKRAFLEQNGWRSPISSSERQELKQEALTAEQREKQARRRKEGIASALDKIGVFSGRLSRSDADLEVIGVMSSSKFPTGVRFVSNPEYAACLSAFKKIEGIFNRGGMNIENLEEISSVGILHVSDIYEKWCLIKIFMILIRDFRFDTEDGWEERIVEASLGRSRNVRFEFTRLDVEMKAILTVQAEMPNGRRPDFVLEVFSTSSQSNDFPFCENDLRGGIVMDAKFRSSLSQAGLQSMLDELVKVKGYDKALDNGRVFILQPCEFTMRPPRSPLDWGFHCDYGAEEVAHEKGWIQVGVSTSGDRSVLHLKRLLAMVFQGVFPEPVQSDDDSGIEPGWVSNSFCIGCGERHAPSSVHARTTKGGGTHWIFTCGRCCVRTGRTHCYACGHHLFKNGTRWTYHQTVADQVTHVICPRCGAYFDEDWE